MNIIDFSATGGFPLSTNILARLQAAFSIFNALGNLAGNLSIISGCELVGTTVADGVVNINGEVLEFRGGPVQARVLVRETTENLMYQNGNALPSLKTRFASFGTGVGSLAWADFKRAYPTTGIDVLVQRIATLEARPQVSNIPIGLVAIWGGTFASIPTGWEEHLPLRGRMPLGMNPADSDFDVVGKFGGIKSKKLSIDEMPAHSHKIYGNDNTANAGSANGEVAQMEDFATYFRQTETVGRGDEFSIMNPYRVVHFIKYIG